MTKKTIDELSYKIIGAAIEVHKDLGPGLLESVYHKCLEYELTQRGLHVDSEHEVPIVYKNMQFRTALRCDLLVNNQVVVELKAVSELDALFTAQVISYMRLLKVPKGILINFHCSNIFKQGQKTFVNELYRMLPD